MMMLKHRRPWFSTTLLVALTVFVVASPAGAATDEWMITPEESKLQVRAGNYAEPIAAIEGPGPQIVLKNPKMFMRLRSPINIFIAFEPGKSGKPADMETLKVTLIGFIDINITDRLREYIRGTSLDVEEAKLPSGEHRLRMRIKDVDGNPNERDVVVTVLKN
jgi:hypothetical protein